MPTEFRVAVTTTGGDGAAVGSAITSLPVNGLIEGISIAYAATAPATTSVSVTESGLVSRDLLSAIVSNTDTNYYPTVDTVDSAGVVTGGSRPTVVAGRDLTVAVTASNALTDCVVVVIRVL